MPVQAVAVKPRKGLKESLKVSQIAFVQKYTLQSMAVAWKENLLELSNG
jgi:hypothetical protein